MRMNKSLELLVGLFVAGGLLAFLFLALKVSDISALSTEEGYAVKARFENVGGLKVRSPVSLGGVRIGRVSAIGIDEASFEAVVTMTLNPAYQLPADSSASIYTAGLLGEQYVGLEPGGADEVLKDGDEIKLTQSALILERLVGQFLFNAAKDDK